MYIDLLIKIKNAQKAKKEAVKTNYSNMDLAVAEVLARKNFIGGIEKKGRLPKRALEVKLRYNKGVGAI